MQNFKEKLMPYFDDVTKCEEYLDYIMSRRTENGCEEYTENHHILPKCLFPEYVKSKWNMIRLKAYDHYHAHYLLAYTKHHDLLWALNNMNRLKSINMRKKYQILTEDQLHQMSLMYAEFREDF
jgi:hypothetical protein